MGAAMPQPLPWLAVTARLDAWAAETGAPASRVRRMRDLIGEIDGCYLVDTRRRMEAATAARRK